MNVSTMEDEVKTNTFCEEKDFDQWLGCITFEKTEQEFPITQHQKRYIPPAVVKAIKAPRNLLLLFNHPRLMIAESKVLYRPILSANATQSVYILQHEGMATINHDPRNCDFHIGSQWFIFNNKRELESADTEQASVCLLLLFIYWYEITFEYVL